MCYCIRLVTPITIILLSVFPFCLPCYKSCSFQFNVRIYPCLYLYILHSSCHIIRLKERNCFTATLMLLKTRKRFSKTRTRCNQVGVDRRQTWAFDIMIDWLIDWFIGYHKHELLREKIAYTSSYSHKRKVPALWAWNLLRKECHLT